MKRIQSIMKYILRGDFQRDNPLNAMPDFSSISYRFVCPPKSPRIPAWDKLHECERRLEFYKWAESLNDPAKAQHRIILDDSFSAFLLTYEATIQYIRESFKKSQIAPKLDNWLLNQPQYGIICKGLRTLRHLEAHIQDIPIMSLVKVAIGGGYRNGTSATNVSRIWRLPPMDKSKLNKLHAPAIKPSDLTYWNTLVEKQPARDLLEDAVLMLADILKSAEQVV